MGKQPVSVGDRSVTDEAARLRSALHGWYRANGRHALPWRQTRDPYAVLVSEVMLQQTQVERVLPCYERWLGRWPTAAALAAASPADAIREWAGLGYNRRALWLHAAGCEAAAAGGVPRTVAGLRRLPGVGSYTAAAVACFAGGARVPLADTNVGRVLARVLLGEATPRAAGHAAVAGAAAGFLPARGARGHNLALMDLGALVCTSRAPACETCPLARGCRWRALGAPAGPARERPAPAFATTARFARGRIIAALREQPATYDALAALLPPAHAARLPTYLNALQREGLITERDGLWALPGEENFGF